MNRSAVHSALLRHNDARIRARFSPSSFQPTLFNEPHSERLIDWRNPRIPEIEHALLPEILVRRIRQLPKAKAHSTSFTVLDDDYISVESFLRKAFEKKRSLYASDLADALGMDYGKVREIVAQMIDEGKLNVK